MRFLRGIVIFLSLFSITLAGRWEAEVDILTGIQESLALHKSLQHEPHTVSEEYEYFAQMLTKAPKGVLGMIACQKASDHSKSDIDDCKAMQEKISDIIHTLDAEDKSLESVLSGMDWKLISEHAKYIFDVISTVEEQMLMFVNAPLDVASMFQDMYKTSYMANFNHPAVLLKSLILERSSPISSSMLEKAREMKGNDMRELAKVAAFLMRNLLRTLLQEYSFMALTNSNPQSMKKMDTDWEATAAEIIKRGVEADLEIWDSWSYQSYLDVDQIGQEINKDESINNRKAAEQIKLHLQNKFPNRNWFVLVHKSTQHNPKDRYYENCNDYVHSFGRIVVIVNSIDVQAKEPKTNLRGILSPIADYEDGYGPKALIARDLFFRFNNPSCGVFRFSGAIEAKANPEVQGPTNHILVRLVAIKRSFHKEKPYYLFAFA